MMHPMDNALLVDVTDGVQVGGNLKMHIGIEPLDWTPSIAAPTRSTSL